MMLEAFFSQHPVFGYQELHRHLSQNHEYKDTTLKALLQYHVKEGHIIRIRRGYYAVTTSASNLGAYDSLLIAGRVNDSSILAYHTALSFHGIAYSLLNTTFYITNTPTATFQFQDTTFKAILPPKALRPNNLFVETLTLDRLGLTIKVTNIERSLVDCLDKPQFSGGYEEVWRSANMIEFIDVQRMIDYAITLNKPTTVAKVGFFLEAHKEKFIVEEKLLSQLEPYKPKGISHLSRGSSDNIYLKRWKLVVPSSIKNQSWEEPHVDI